MEREKLDALMQALENSSVKECEISTRTSKIKMVRGNAVPGKQRQVVPVADRPAAPVAAAAWKQKEAEPDMATQDICSEWVGYFYRSAQKDGKPLFKLRDRIEKGKQVGIVITMNVVHKVVSPIAGKLTEVLVEEGHAVEYDQPLLRLTTEEQENTHD